MIDLNYKSYQYPMTCIDLTSKRSKMLSYVAKHSKQRKTTKPIKLQWIASIGCQNDQNKPKLQKWSESNDIGCQNDQNKPKLQKWSESNDLQVTTIKKLSYVARHSKQRKTTKPIKVQLIALIGYQNDQNKAKL